MKPKYLQRKWSHVSQRLNWNSLLLVARERETWRHLLAVFWMTATERDVFQLEEVKTLLPLQGKRKTKYLFYLVLNLLISIDGTWLRAKAKVLKGSWEDKLQTELHCRFLMGVTCMMEVLLPDNNALRLWWFGSQRVDGPCEQSDTGPGHWSSRPCRWPPEHRLRAADLLSACYTPPAGRTTQWKAECDWVISLLRNETQSATQWPLIGEPSHSGFAGLWHHQIPTN